MRKKPRRNSVYENSSKVRRNTSPQERWKNYEKRKQSQTNTLIGKVDMLANTQNSIMINKGKDLKASKNRFNRYGAQAGSRTDEKNISTVWIVGQFDLGQLRCGTSLVQYFGASKFTKNVGPAARAHVNSCILACKYTEIFRNNLHSRISKG